MQSYEIKKLEYEWALLIKEAKQLNLTQAEVRNFLQRKNFIKEDKDTIK